MSRKKISNVEEGNILKASLRSDPKSLIYLIKIPKHTPISVLDSIKIKKFASGCTVDSIQSESTEFVLESGAACDVNCFRALVDRGDGIATLGKAFSGCLSLRKVFKESERVVAWPVVCNLF